jgi:hypothetical protein
MLSLVRRADLRWQQRVQSRPWVKSSNAERDEINRSWSAFSGHGIDI